ncbi:MAG: MgtC/SapB family protein [Burkholderiaceae bacterium]
MPDLAQRILDAALDEFSDLPDAGQLTRVVLRIAVAILLGALIGYERELRQSSAGLRTHMLVALGAALFVLVPQQAGVSEGDMSRVLQGVIAGVGFLGAGAVLKRDDTDQIRGLTTAASIWVTAAIGIAVGLGREATAVTGTIAVLLILAVLRRFARRTGGRAAGQARDAPRSQPPRGHAD